MADMNIEESYCTNLLQTMYEFQQKGYLCDTILKADDGELLAHSAVLAAASSVFKQGLPACDTPLKHVIVLPGFRCHVLDIALHLIYCGSLDMQDDKDLMEDELARMMEYLSKLDLQNPPVEHYAFNLLRTMYEFQQDNYLCDSLILADDIKFRAHSAVLAAASELFKQGLPATDDEPMEHVITLPDYSYLVMEVALRIMYCGNSQILHLLSQHEQLTQIIPALQKLGLKLPEIACSSVNGGHNVVNTDDCIAVKGCSFDQTATASDDSNGGQDDMADSSDNDGNYSDSTTEASQPAAGKSATAGHTTTSAATSLELQMVIVKLERSDELDEMGMKLMETSAIKTETNCNERDIYGSLFPNPSLPAACNKIKEEQSDYESDCCVCNARISRSSMPEHMERWHSGRRKTGITQPPKVENAENMLTSEFQSKLARALFECDICNAKFGRRFILNRHLELHDRDVGKPKYTCQECGTRFTRKTFLSSHRHAMHSVSTNRKMFGCDACNSKFANRWNLKKHMKLHVGEPTCTCQDCGASFTRSLFLRAHRRAAHSARQTFDCDVCNAKLACLANLKKHMKMHVGALSCTCQECGAGFTRMCYLNVHMRKLHPNVTTGKTFDCVICNVKLATLSNLQMHLKSHVGEPSHKCPECGATFACHQLLLRHVRTTHDPDTQNRSFRCSICFETFQLRYRLKRHRRMAHRRAGGENASDQQPKRGRPPLELHYICPLPDCLKRFADRQYLYQHMSHSHGELGQETEKQSRFMCDKCPKSFTGKNALQIHLKIVHCDARPYSCTMCAMSFKMKHCLQGHVARIHSEAPPSILCSVCGRGFKFAGDLKNHMSVHSDERPFQCASCPATYKTMCTLRSHISLVHDGKPRYQCKLCDRVYTALTSLKEHMETHSGERRHVCSTCGKAFVLRRVLLKHERVHTGVRKYICQVCGKRFGRSHHLHQHMSTHCPREKKILRCKYCEKTFLHMYNLQVHSRRIHGVDLRKLNQPPGTAGNPNNSPTVNADGHSFHSNNEPSSVLDSPADVAFKSTVNSPALH